LSINTKKFLFQYQSISLAAPPSTPYHTLDLLDSTANMRFNTIAAAALGLMTQVSAVSIEVDQVDQSAAPPVQINTISLILGIVGNVTADVVLGDLSAISPSALDSSPSLLNCFGFY
jgi:hypothetical protein